MPRIPDYTQQVQPQVANVPDQPHLNLEGGLEGIRKIANANISLGETGMKFGELLAKHAQEQQKLKNEAWIANTDTNFRLGLQDKLLNDSQETVNVGGQDVTRPAGILNRKLDQAAGSLDEFDNYYRTQRSSYLSQVKDPEMAIKLGEKLDANYTTSRELVIKNEAKQGRDSLVNSQVSNSKQQIHDAAAITDSNGLLKAVDNLGKTSGTISQIKGEDPTTAEKFRLEQNGNLVANSITSTLNSTGDLTKAQQMLDAVKEHIEPDRYDKLNTMLTTGSEKIQRQQERAQTVQSIGNEADWLTNLSAGKLSWTSIDDIAGAVRSGQISDKFGLAMVDVIKSQGNYTSISAENENYPAFVDSIYKARDQKELHDSLLNILQDHKNISQEKLAVLINGAMSRGKNLPISLKQGDDPQINPKQQEIDAGALAITNFGKSADLKNTDIADIYQNYNNLLTGGKSVKEAYDASTKNQIIKNYPSAVTTESAPNVVINKDTPQRFFLKETSAGNAPYIYDPKSKSIVPNRNYKEKRNATDSSGQ